MKIKTRMTHQFIELTIDAIDETIFKGETEIDETINNLLGVVNDLKKYTDKNFNEELEELKK